MSEETTITGAEPDAMTVCFSTKKSLPCTKVFTEQTADPSIDLPRRFRVRYVSAATIDDMYKNIVRLSSRTDCLVVRGSLRPDVKYDDKEGVARSCRSEDAPFKETARSWLALDIDDVYAPANSSTEVALEWLREKLQLSGVSHVGQLTSKYLVGGRKANALRVRLWLKLDRPLNDREAKAFAAMLNGPLATNSGGGIDRSLYNPVQPHFVNSPVFKDLKNPVPEEDRVFFYRGDLDALEVPMREIRLWLENTSSVDLDGIDLANMPPPQQDQIEAAIVRMEMDQDVPAGDRHRKMMGWVGELIALGADPDLIHESADSFLRNNGREPSSTEVADAVRWMFEIRAKTGTLTTFTDRDGSEFGDMPDIKEPAPAQEPAAPVVESDGSIDLEDEEEEDEESCAPMQGQLALPGNSPRDAANAYMRLRLSGGKDFVHYGGFDWYWRDNCWVVGPDNALEIKVHNDSTFPIDTAERVARNIRAARSVGLLQRTTLPLDLQDLQGVVPRAISFRNGLVHLDDFSYELATPTRRWFGIPHIEIDYVPEAKCPRWLDFLDEAVPEEDQRRELQKMTGYLLSNDTSHQRFFQITGRGGTGKGVFTRVLQSLIGIHNTFATTIDSLADRFGLRNAIGKSLMLLQEASGDRIAKSSVITNYIKLISGEDAVEIRAHGRPAIPYEKLPLRILLIANAPPPFRDDSDALARRLMCFRFDTTPKKRIRKLSEMLLKEKEGIVNWALQGLQMLDDEGFIDPSSSADLKRETLRAASPTLSFVEDCCERCNTKHGLSFPEIYDLYVAWCRRTNAEGSVANPDALKLRLSAQLGSPRQCRVDAKRAKTAGSERPYLYPVKANREAIATYMSDEALYDSLTEDEKS